MQNETMLEANGGVRSKQSEGLWVSKELEQLFVVVARYMAYQLVGGSLGHGLVGALAGVEVVAVGIVALGERSGDEGAAVHLGEACQIEADVDGVATVYGIVDGVALRLGAGHEGYADLASKGDGDVADKDLGEGDGLGAGEVGKTETQLAAVERHADGVSQREVLGIDGLTAIGDAGGISPTSHPLHVIAHTLIDN